MYIPLMVFHSILMMRRPQCSLLRMQFTAFKTEAIALQMDQQFLAQNKSIFTMIFVIFFLGQTEFE